MDTQQQPSHKEIPQLEGALPVLGHAVDFKRAPIDLLTRGWRRHGEVFGLRLLNQDVVVLIGPKANEAFFRAPDSQLSPQEVYRFMTPIFGKGIAYDAAPEVMSEQLSFLVPALRDGAMRTYAQLMTEEAEQYFDTWGAQGEVDLVDAMTELTTFISGRCLVGQEFREGLTEEFAQLYHDLEGGINQVAMFFPHLPIPSLLKRDRARVRMGKLIGQIVAGRKRKGIKSEDFLQALIDARYHDGRPLTDEEITGLLLTILFAGHHTSAVLSSWLAILLQQNPHCLAPILKEQQDVHGADGAISFESLKQLPQLENAIHEASRMTPPLVMLMRKAMQPLHYNGFTIDAGKMVMVSPAVSHRDPRTFPSPHVFDPKRHEAPREEYKQPYAIIAFGGGKHRCMGTHFAFMQIKALFSVLLRRYELELLTPTYTPNYGGFVVGPHQPARVRYRRRKSPQQQAAAKPPRNNRHPGSHVVSPTAAL